MARFRKQHVGLGILLILLIAMIAGAYMVMGTTVYSADDVKTIAVYDATGTQVAISSWDADDGVLTIEPASDVAKIVITYDFKFKDIESQANYLYIDLSGVEGASGVDVDTVKVVLSDGTYDLTVGVINLGEDEELKTFTIDPEDYDNFDDYAYVKVIIMFYDENGTLVNYMEGGAESEIATDFKVMLNTTSVNAFFASVVIAIVVAIRKVAHAIVSVITSAAAAIITNSALITLAIPLVIAFFAFTDTGKRTRRKLFGI